MSEHCSDPAAGTPSTPAPVGISGTPVVLADPSDATFVAALAGVDLPGLAVVEAAKALPTIPLKACCGLLAGDWCDCAEFAAEAAEVFEKPYFLDLRAKGAVA